MVPGRQVRHVLSLGVYSVPVFENEWYPRFMYDADHEIYEERDLDGDAHDQHVETYGLPDEAPYQDFAAEFTAENFNAEEWADLSEEIGARFAGPTAEHHDGWSNRATSA